MTGGNNAMTRTITSAAIATRPARRRPSGSCRARIASQDEENARCDDKDLKRNCVDNRVSNGISGNAKSTDQRSGERTERPCDKNPEKRTEVGFRKNQRTEEPGGERDSAYGARPSEYSCYGVRYLIRSQLRCHKLSPEQPSRQLSGFACRTCRRSTPRGFSPEW